MNEPPGEKQKYGLSGFAGIRFDIEQEVHNAAYAIEHENGNDCGDERSAVARYDFVEIGDMNARTEVLYEEEKTVDDPENTTEDS